MTYYIIILTILYCHREVRKIQLTERQKRIIEIVKEHQPITSEQISSIIGITRATLRPDLSLLTMSGYLDGRPKVGYFYPDERTKSEEVKKVSHRLVGDVMSIPVIVDDTVSVHSAIITMFLEDVGSLFITSNSYLSGVVSRKDLLKSAIGGGDIASVPVSMAMTRMPNVAYVKADERVEDAIRKLIIHEVDSLPVVYPENEDNLKIVGRFSKTNVTRLFTELIKN